MASNNPYVKSLIYLVSAGAIGYGLMRLTAPSEEKLKRIQQSSSATALTDAELKKLQFMRHMRAAANAETPPIYMQKKEK